MTEQIQTIQSEKLIFDTPAQFSLHIEELAVNYDSYLECLLTFCEEKMIDYEDAAKLLTQPLKQKIFEEAQKQYSMPKNTTHSLDL